ncbi:hypothetical protein [Pseudoroseicyclus aestuarii]|uniref:ElaB/YqjD/DUF883 family membrane-anchored ribosome-binding protein n=1 Tax=Pseudoroseicyclus aestuarii TaxID=1795041 RepID=A0A318T5T1_9RHOB|nr:hypothetical protein [Pseudoroseicyclus aestuarii]PYE83718.1 hypothetical protein DFP88_10376 [Pseudoroseicyclus aestuarii]
MANDTTEKMEQRAKQAADDARHGAAEMADAARERVGEMASEARQKAWDYGRDTKNDVASETSKVAEALRKAADDLHAGSPQEKLIARAADGIADGAEALREMELDEIAHEVNDFARRNPIGFLGGAALLGFAAARFVKSSARRADYDRHDDVDRPAPSERHFDSAAPGAPTSPASPAARPAATTPGTATPGGTGTKAPGGFDQASTGGTGRTSSVKD